MKRHALSLALVLLALALLYGSKRGLEVTSRLFAEILPGGFRVIYFADSEFGHRACSRSERRLVKDYGAGRPARGVPRDHHSARWTGWLKVPETGTYGFFLQVKGGARVYLDEQLLVDHWDSPGWTQGKHAEAFLRKGRYRMRVEHRKEEGEGAIRLRWVGGPIPADTVVGVPHVTKGRRADEP